jgi:hypothetical protein
MVSCIIFIYSIYFKYSLNAFLKFSEKMPGLLQSAIFTFHINPQPISICSLVAFKTAAVFWAYTKQAQNGIYLISFGSQSARL